MPAAIPFIVAGGEVLAGAAAASEVVAGLYYAAAATTAVGALAGDSDLQKLGTIVGVAASGAGLIDSATSAASAADAARTGANAATTDLPASAATPASDAARLGTDAAGPAASPAGDDLEQAGLMGGDPGSPASPSSTMYDQKGLIGQEMTSAPAPAPAASAMTDPSSAAAPPASPPAGPAGPPSGGPAAPAAPTAPQAPTPYGPGSGWGQDTLGAGQVYGSAPAADPSFWGRAEAWLKANPNTAKVGGGLIQGAMGYIGQQQIANDNLGRAKNYQDWIRQRYSDSVRNLQVPTPFTQAPLSTPTKRVTGIIQQVQG